MNEKFIIQGELPSMNEIIAISKKHWGDYARKKREITQNISLLIKSQVKKKYEKVDLSFTWYCKNKRKDKDNIIAGQKFIIDALVEAEIIKNDGWNEIGNIFHFFEVDAKNPRIEVIIKEV